MTKKETSIIAVFCVILIILAGIILIRYYNRVSEYSAATKNEEIISVTGYHYSTRAKDLIVSENTTDITSRRTFTHRIFTQQNQNLAVVTITVNGSISADNTEISHVSASLADEQMDGLTVSQHISGQTATVVLYVNQISVCHFQYRLLSDGNIEFLSNNL